ncbi:MAG: YafY family transcriptional regulator [Pelagimonas sp.]|jgi:predicted DNA-binding transcriptional regulator YafY|nr:YafY family transcriptional regulator [Pelagimonas sp.]
MRRSDRLSALVEILQDGRLHLARDLADQLDVSVRTIYRDMDTLEASGVPIEGERGVGYLLREPVFLPPVALSLTELEALHLGVAMVQKIADPELRRAAKILAGKIDKVSRAEARIPQKWGFGVYVFAQEKLGLRFMPLVRQSIRERLKLTISYTSLQGERSDRVVRPLNIDFWGQVWTLTCWCEKRNDFRTFRMDHIMHCHATGDRFQDEPGKTHADFLKTVDHMN